MERLRQNLRVAQGSRVTRYDYRSVCQACLVPAASLTVRRPRQRPSRTTLLI